jgi:hypothetical protein
MRSDRQETGFHLHQTFTLSRQNSKTQTVISIKRNSQTMSLSIETIDLLEVSSFQANEFFFELLQNESDVTEVASKALFTGTEAANSQTVQAA